jgi:hypothetical protein
MIIKAIKSHNLQVEEEIAPKFHGEIVKFSRKMMGK